MSITPKQAQMFQGALFVAMGLGTMLMPKTILELSFHKDLLDRSGGITPALLLTFCCFGAQASLCGLLALTCEFTHKTWIAWIAGIFPFIILDFVALKMKFCTPFGFFGDLFGNIVFTVCGIIGLLGTKA
jgi:hypothetical protein